MILVDTSSSLLILILFTVAHQPASKTMFGPSNVCPMPVGSLLFVYEIGQQTDKNKTNLLTGSSCSVNVSLALRHDVIAG